MSESLFEATRFARLGRKVPCLLWMRVRIAPCSSLHGVLRRRRTASILPATQPRSSRGKRHHSFSVERALSVFLPVEAHRVLGVWVGCETGRIVGGSVSIRG